MIIDQDSPFRQIERNNVNIHIQSLSIPKGSEKHLLQLMKVYENEITDISINHSFGIAKLLDEMGFDHSMITAILVYPFFKAEHISINKIQRQFGKEIAHITNNFHKLVSIKLNDQTMIHEAELLQKMFISLSTDIRVLIIKLASCLQNTLMIKQFNRDTRKQIIREIEYIYLPLSDRLGMWRFKSAMEDIIFHVQHPHIYKKLQYEFDSIAPEAEKSIQNISTIIKNTLKVHDIEPLRSHKRVKTIASIYKKMKIKSKKLHEIYDIYAIRIIVNNITECYRTLGVIHSQWTPFAFCIKDYIASPKINGYRSLHTTITTEDSRPVEIQICTHDMFMQARFGMGSHFVYSKEKESTSPTHQEKEWIKQIQSIQMQLSEGHMPDTKMNLFSSKMFILGDNQHVFEIPKHATPVDFAFYHYEEIAIYLESAFINGRKRSIHGQLTNGDSLRLQFSDKPQLENQWKEKVKTSKAKGAIQSYLD